MRSRHIGIMGLAAGLAMVAPALGRILVSDPPRPRRGGIVVENEDVTGMSRQRKRAIQRQVKKLSRKK